MKRPAERVRHRLGEECLAGARLALDEQRPLERERGVDRELQVVGRDVGFGAFEAHCPNSRVKGMIIDVGNPAIFTLGADPLRAAAAQAIACNKPASPRSNKRIGEDGLEEHIMATPAATLTSFSDSEQRRQLRRAIIASTVGTTIEWYDFFLYSTVTGLVFAKLYFPNSDPLTGTLQAFAIYAVGFVARPVGAAIFGHYGDRIGRKSTLIATLILMGVATFAVAFVPTYDRIGIWGAVLLTLLRFIQGVGVGGEWGGSVLMSMEWTRTNAHRGFVASWPQFGVPAGLFLANLAVFAFSALSGDQFLSWGWRVPFFLSIVLVGVGLYIRLNILETPIFAKLLAENKIERAPMLEVIKRQPREILLSALARMAEQAPFYIFTAFIFSYATTTLKESRDFVLIAVLVASVLSF